LENNTGIAGCGGEPVTRYIQCEDSVNIIIGTITYESALVIIICLTFFCGMLFGIFIDNLCNEYCEKKNRIHIETLAVAAAPPPAPEIRQVEIQESRV